jgi:hypothetical protein
MPILRSKLIQGTKPEAETLKKIQEHMGVPAGVSINLMVFEVEYDRKKYYCCWSGGALQDGQPHLTLIGQAAMEALANLPMGSNDTFVLQELALGSTPLRDKVKATLKRTPSNAKICFFGDMSGELDGHMHHAFNVGQGTIDIAQ